VAQWKSDDKINENQKIPGLLPIPFKITSRGPVVSLEQVGVHGEDVVAEVSGQPSKPPLEFRPQSYFQLHRVLI
jgi:hypothetical protein